MSTSNISKASVLGREITITRMINASRELVFEAWTKPEHLSRWYGPDGFKTTTHRMELKPGGVWEFTMHGPDGRDYPNRIHFIEIIKPERLVYKHAGDDDTEPVNFKAKVTFESKDKGTLVTMLSIFDSAEDLQRVVETYGAVEGGKQTLGRLDNYLSNFNNE